MKEMGPMKEMGTMKGWVPARWLSVPILWVLLALVTACQTAGVVDPHNGQTSAPTPAGSAVLNQETAVLATTSPAHPSRAPEPETPLGSLSATPQPTGLPTVSPTPIRPPTATPTSTAPVPPWTESHTIGFSVGGLPLESIRFGDGPRLLVVMAAIHGGHECNTYDLALGLMERIRDEPGLIAAEWTVKIIPVANPDGCLDGSRQNLNGVDLNRNWDTEDWTADAEGPDGIVAGSGGQFPFSEPETVALRDWFLAQSELYEQPIKVISYHSTVPGTGLAQPGYDLPGRPVERADRMARAYAEATGYLYSAVWVGTYTITGEFIYWASEQGLEAIDVELPDRGPADSIPVGWDESSTETNLRGLLAIMTMD